ncbi:MAG: hypothetical protein H7276_01210 [Caulobacter sp.]|nr:hypothetical protein [Vitreoscilla sp.]
MFRTLTAVAAFAALSTLACTSALAQTATPARKVAAKKPAAKAEPVAAINDDLNPGQLSMADRVLTGVADCEFKEKVNVEKIVGHTGNFKVTYDHRTYVMVPEETTTGAIRLVDTAGAVVWIQIPMKSMLMNQKEHHRLVDNCQEDEQRIAVQAMQNAGTNAGSLAPNVASPAAVAAANGLADAKAANAAAVETAPPGSTVTTTSTTTVTTKATPMAPVKSAKTPSTAASGMWK